MPWVSASAPKVCILALWIATTTSSVFATEAELVSVWRKLLFFDGASSVIDHHEFFLTEAGKHDAAAELGAHLEAFSTGASVTREGRRVSVACVFPARYHLLRNHFSIQAQHWPSPPACPPLESYLGFADYQGVSLVFSNFFANSPPSMFGHTFLRLHRRPPPGPMTRSELFDEVLNYSAQVPDSRDPLQPIKGLFGVYKGAFMLLPYFQKVQEYNNLESRDLWEYRLELHSTEIEQLVRLIWELLPTKSDYYFLDDNCSYLLVKLIEAAAPRLSLASKLPSTHTLPSDTVRAVMAVPGLVKRFSPRVSSLSRFRSYFQQLSPQQQHWFEQALAERSLAAMGRGECSLSCEQLLLDTLIEYVEFREKVAGQKNPVFYADIYSQALSRRAQLRATAKPVPLKPFSTPPHLGHRSSLWGVQQMSTAAGYGYLGLQWRPALHDLLAPSAGYDALGQIRFMHIKAGQRFDYGQTASPPQLHLRSFTVLDILSLNPNSLAQSSYAWRFNSGYRQPVGCSEGCGEGFLNLLLGKNASFLHEKLTLYGLAGPYLAHLDRLGFDWGAQVQVGALLQVFSEPVKLMLTGSQLWWGSGVAARRELSLTGAYSWGSQYETRLSLLQGTSGGEGYSLGLLAYL